jgi:hypothetical protein
MCKRLSVGVLSISLAFSLVLIIPVDTPAYAAGIHKKKPKKPQPKKPHHSHSSSYDSESTSEEKQEKHHRSAGGDGGVAAEEGVAQSAGGGGGAVAAGAGAGVVLSQPQVDDANRALSIAKGICLVGSDTQLSIDLAGKLNISKKTPGGELKATANALNAKGAVIFQNEEIKSLMQKATMDCMERQWPNVYEKLHVQK